jgi:hypothetical protein
MGIVLFVLALAAWLGPKILRMLKLEFTAVSSWMRSWGSGEQIDRQATSEDPIEKFFLRHRYLWEDLPQGYREALKKENISPDVPAIRAVGCKEMGVSNQIGYLLLTPGEIVFICKRLIGYKLIHIAQSGIQEIREQRRWIVDTVEIDLGRQVYDLEIFKSPGHPATDSVNIPSPTTA